MIWSKQKFEVNINLKSRNPVEEAIEATKPPTPKKHENDVRDGILLIFHGSPYSSTITTYKIYSSINNALFCRLFSYRE